MRKLILVLIVAISFMSCKKEIKSMADKQMQEQTAKQMQEANKQIGMPAIVNFQERKLMKMILELRDDESLICYAYLYNRDKGEVGQFLGKCLGFGLPYSVQYTNPQKIIEAYEMLGYNMTGIHPLSVPQADPNGLFMPTGLSATWLMLLDDKGKPHPVYVEPEIIVSPFTLK